MALIGRYQHFEMAYWTAWPLKMGLMGCPKILVTNYQLMLYNILEEQRPLLCHNRSPKSPVINIYHLLSFGKLCSSFIVVIEKGQHFQDYCFLRYDTMYIVWWLGTNILEKSPASIFRAQEGGSNFSEIFIPTCPRRPWFWYSLLHKAHVSHGQCCLDMHVAKCFLSCLQWQCRCCCSVWSEQTCLALNFWGQNCRSICLVTLILFKKVASWLYAVV